MAGRIHSDVYGWEDSKTLDAKLPPGFGGRSPSPRREGSPERSFSEDEFDADRLNPRLDAHKLEDELDFRLEQRQAKRNGICPIRKEIYDWVFEAIIRQVSALEPKRGVLLRRVRNESLLTQESYKTLYAQSLLFAQKHASLSEVGKAEMMDQISGLEAEVAKLRSSMKDLTDKAKAIEKADAEEATTEQEKRARELDLINRSNKQLDDVLNILDPERKRKQQEAEEARAAALQAEEEAKLKAERGENDEDEEMEDGEGGGATKGEDGDEATAAAQDGEKEAPATEEKNEPAKEEVKDAPAETAQVEQAAPPADS